MPEATPTTTDEELMRLIARGESQAFALLMRRHLRGAVAVGLEYARDLDEAEDIAQDAFHRVWGSASRFDPNQRFRPWFFTIVRNLGRNAAAKHKRRGEVELHDVHAVSASRDADIRRRIDAELQKLPEMQASCFRLVEIEGFSAEEVADMMDIASATVRTHCFRARQKLREALETNGLS